MIDVFITHYSDGRCRFLEDLTVATCRAIRHTTPELRLLCVVGAVTPNTAKDEFCTRLHRERVDFVLPGPAHQPAARNAVMRLARGRAEGREDPFVLLHNDVRPAVGWSDRLRADLLSAEMLWGPGRCIVSPQFEPITRAELDTWQGTCPPWRPATDDGHQLMMFITRPSFFDDVGGCDEAFDGMNLDDTDWGMRALLAGKKNLLSQTAIVAHVGHKQSVSFDAAHDRQELDRMKVRNMAVFRAKWGARGLDAALTGRVWAQIRSGAFEPPAR